jgi:hypothetical protein
MRVLLVGAALLVGAGCANSTALERASREHETRAQSLAQARDYDDAAVEHHEAQRLHAKAVKKAYKEGNSASVAIPEPPTQPPPAY